MRVLGVPGFVGDELEGAALVGGGLGFVARGLGVAAGASQVFDDLRPAHVGVLDAGVDEDDQAAQAPDRDRLGVLGAGGAH